MVSLLKRGKNYPVMYNKNRLLKCLIPLNAEPALVIFAVYASCFKVVQAAFQLNDKRVRLICLYAVMI